MRILYLGDRTRLSLAPPGDRGVLSTPEKIRGRHSDGVSVCDEAGLFRASPP